MALRTNFVVDCLIGQAPQVTTGATPFVRTRNANQTSGTEKMFPEKQRGTQTGPRS